MIKYHLEDYAIAAGCRFEKPADGDSAYDIYSSIYIELFDDVSHVHTGLRIEIPHGHAGIIKDRSSMASQNVVTHAGVIDRDYRGELIIVMSMANADGYYEIEPGDKIAQLLIVPVLSTYGTKQVSLDELTQTERGDKGFGSTGA